MTLKKQRILNFWINFLIFVTLSTDLLYSNFQVKTKTKHDKKQRFSPKPTKNSPKDTIFRQ